MLGMLASKLASVVGKLGRGLWWLVGTSSFIDSLYEGHKVLKVRVLVL